MQVDFAIIESGRRATLARRTAGTRLQEPQVRSLDDREKETQQLWVERRSGAGQQLVEAALQRPGRLVRPNAAQRVEGIGDAHHPRLDRDAVGAQTVRVPGAVPVLVV